MRRYLYRLANFAFCCGCVSAAFAQTWYVVDAGYVSFSGYRTDWEKAPRAIHDPNLQELDAALRGKFREEAAALGHGYLEDLGASLTNVQIARLEGNSLQVSDVDPDQVALWLVTLGSVLAVPDAFSYSTEKQTDEELNLTLALHLVHLRTSKIIFSQQALVVKRWQSGQPLSSDNFVRLLLTGAQRALHNDARARAALRGALQRRAFEGLSQEVYAISAKDVAIPEGFRQGIIQQFPPPKGDELLANLRELFALEVAHGLSGFRSVLPPIPEELVAELEVGSEQRPSLWATFSLGAIQDLNLPPGVKLDRTSDGLMVVSGQFPKPDFRLRVNFTYGEEECGRTEFQRATQGTLIVRLDEDAKSSRNELLRTRPVHARAAYPRGYPSAHRALSGCLKAAFLPENLKPAIVTKLSTP